jgi:hypothetical protein
MLSRSTLFEAQFMQTAFSLRLWGEAWVTGRTLIAADFSVAPPWSSSRPSSVGWVPLMLHRPRLL